MTDANLFKLLSLTVVVVSLVGCTTTMVATAGRLDATVVKAPFEYMQKLEALKDGREPIPGTTYRANYSVLRTYSFALYRTIPYSAGQPGVEEFKIIREDMRQLCAANHGNFSWNDYIWRPYQKYQMNGFGGKVQCSSADGSRLIFATYLIAQQFLYCPESSRIRSEDGSPACNTKGAHWEAFTEVELLEPTKSMRPADLDSLVNKYGTGKELSLSYKMPLSGDVPTRMVFAFGANSTSNK